LKGARKMNDDYFTTVAKLIWELEYQASKNNDKEILQKALDLKIILHYRNNELNNKGEN
jgi:hypothetical protein